MVQLLLGAAVLLVALIIGLWWVTQTSSEKTKERKGTAENGKREKQQRKREVTILYGTQTGTAQRFAGELKDALAAKFGGGRGFSIVDVEDYPHEDDLPRESLVFLMMATYGEGEPTETATAFVSWLTGLSNSGSGPGGALQGVRFGVFGLGNRQYADFCVVGGKVHRAMEAAGAQPVVRNGEGNDDDNIQADFDAWKARLLEALDAAGGLTAPE